MGPTVVDRLHTDFSGLLAVLGTADKVSLRNVADENFRDEKQKQSAKICVICG